MILRHKNLTAFVIALVFTMISVMIPVSCVYTAAPTDDAASPRYIAITAINTYNSSGTLVEIDDTYSVQVYY